MNQPTARSRATSIAASARSPIPTAFIALVRAANVGGTGKLPMATLKSICGDAGFDNVKTYITSGNAVFTSRLSESDVRTALEQRLERFMGKPVAVIVRTGQEMAAIIAANPFREMPPSRTVAIFFQQPPPRNALDQAVGLRSERLALGSREIYVHYGDRMADSKLRFPGAEPGTARNMNTIAKLAAMALGPGRADGS